MVCATPGIAPAGQMSFYLQVKKTEDIACCCLLNTNHSKSYRSLKKKLAITNCIYVEDTNTCVLPECF